MNDIVFHPIGIIHTAFKQCADTPAQGCLAKDARGTVEVFPQYTGGLSDIEGFSHLVLLYHFHQAEGFELRAKPLLDETRRGVFATRYYRRPNPIGMSIVELISVSGNSLEVGWVDMLDGTPLLDIKPYVSRFDARKEVKDGWFTHASGLNTKLLSDK